MVDGTRTSTEQMFKTESDVDGVADRLTAMLTTLMSELAPLESSWQGMGAGSFVQVKETVDTEVRKLNVALRSIAEAVGSSGKTYVVTDEEMKSEMDSAIQNAGSITTALTT